MNAAIRIRTAIELLERATNDMDRAGVAGQARQRLDDLVADLKKEHSMLPARIMDLERDRCASCEHYRQEAVRQTYDNGVAPRLDTKCTAGCAYQCPTVRILGFADPADPLSDVSRFLMRQAD